jgi:hypothetical protein
MTEDQKISEELSAAEANQFEDGKTRYVYHAMVKFSETNERQGEVIVAATDINAARKLILDMMGARDKFELIDLFATKDVTKDLPPDAKVVEREIPAMVEDAEIVEMDAKTIN